MDRAAEQSLSFSWLILCFQPEPTLPPFLFTLFCLPTNWLPPYILSVANHFPILQPLTLTLTLPCLCH